jgi:hypothetical protein
VSTPPPERSFGTNGTIGTVTPYPAKPSTEASALVAWREALLALS